MKNLARHIELLLRNSDCVILPGFGGFIAHDVPAYYVSEEKLYYPPSRSISFNAAITMNDGLLAQSYMRSYQVDYARATYMVDMAIEELTDTLYEEGIVTLPHIGTITQNMGKSLQFAPVQSGIAAPLHFGLGSFAIRELSQLEQTTKVSQKLRPTITRTTKSINLNINKEILHRVVSTAAVFLLLLMVALPTGNHRPTDVASLQLTELIMTPQVQTAEQVPIPTTMEDYTVSDDVTQSMTTPLVVEEPASTPEAENPTDDAELVILPTVEPVVEPLTTERTPTTVDVSKEKTFHIIVASLPNHRGAEETLSRFVHMGYPEASLVERDNRVRISLVQFTDKNDANEYLKTLRQNEIFQNAWLLAVRN